MAKLNFPDDIKKLKERVLLALNPIKEADEKTKASKDFLFSAQRTNAGRNLPPYQLVYFMFHDLLGFKDLGRFEKIAWSIPIEFNNKAFLIEHRKFGVGVFAGNLDQDENDAQEIVKNIHRAVKICKTYFEWLANKAVSESQLNVKNKCYELYARYEYFLNLYRVESTQAEERKDEVHKETLSANAATYYRPYYQLKKNANWLAISTIDSFFSWTEHIFIHFAVVANGIHEGNIVANLISADWPEKFKSAVSIDNKEAKKYFDELIIVRRQLRNFIAHGAFGKNGETFSFHSSAGAVPVLMPHQKEKNRFSFSGELSFDENLVLELIENFIAYMKSSDLAPAMYYVQESGLPTILTMAKDGTYSKAMVSMGEMEKLVENLSYQFDQSANMDW